MFELKDNTILRQQCYFNGQWNDALSEDAINVANPAAGQRPDERYPREGSLFRNLNKESTMFDLKDNTILRQHCDFNGQWEDALSKEAINVTNPAADKVTPRSRYKKPSNKVRLKTIVNDDAKWNFFVRSVFRKAPQSEAAQSLRIRLIKGLESGDWSQVKNDPAFEKLLQTTDLESGTAETFSGEKKRIDLWLENSDFFKQLFTAFQNGNLFSSPNLFTDRLLVDFVLTLPDDTE